jgi:hypothetical protein
MKRLYIITFFLKQGDPSMYQQIWNIYNQFANIEQTAQCNHPFDMQTNDLIIFTRMATPHHHPFFFFFCPSATMHQEQTSPLIHGHYL